MSDIILSVDDDAAAGAVRNQILREAGFEILEAAAVSEALPLADEKQPGLIVLAVELAGIDGFAAAKLLKSDFRTASIPVLHISNHGEHCRGYARSLESGAEGYLESPVEPAVLLSVVRAMMALRGIGEKADHRLTEVAKVEEALRAERERLHLALDAGNTGIWEWDVRTNENFWSEEVWALQGTDRSCVPSFEAWLQAVVPEDRPIARQAALEAARQGTPYAVEFRVRPAGGGERWLLTRGRPRFDANGRVARYIGIALDITARKKAEEAARHASEQRLLALEAARLGAWDYYFGTGEIVWDERSGSMFGLPGGRIQAAEVMARVHPDDRAAVRQALAEVIATPFGGGFHCEYRIGWPDGSEHWIATHGRVYFSGEGDERQPARFLGVNLDITLQKQAEKRLREAQKLESLGLLAGGVAHDFNNLLVGVIGNASLAREMLPPHSPATELLAGVLKAGEQAAHLTRQMLAYSGKGKFQLEVLDLSALVPEMSGLVRPFLSRKTGLEFDLDPHLPPIEADRGQVQQVFMNLTINAAEAIGSQEGCIKVRTGVREVDERLGSARAGATELRPGKYVYLEVGDNGCGMDEATRARIFDPFFSTKFTGRGLGLAAVAGILRGHHGAILVSSTPGKGSCFTALFPALGAAALS